MNFKHTVCLFMFCFVYFEYNYIVLESCVAQAAPLFCWFYWIKPGLTHLAWQLSCYSFVCMFCLLIVERSWMKQSMQGDYKAVIALMRCRISTLLHLALRAWWSRPGRRGLSCVGSSSRRGRPPANGDYWKGTLAYKKGQKRYLTSKNLWFADFMRASVLSKSMVT